MTMQELATKAVTGDKVAQAVWSSLSTKNIIAIMTAEVEERIARGENPWG